MAALGACTHSDIAPAPNPGPATSMFAHEYGRTCGGPTSATPSTVRDIDWCNHVYDADAPGIDFEADRLVLDNGVNWTHVYVCPTAPGEHTTQSWDLVDVAYGDVDGDGVEDAAILIHYYADWCVEGSAENTQVVLLQTVRDGRATPLCTIRLRRSDVLGIAIVDHTVTFDHADGRSARWLWEAGRCATCASDDC